MNRDSKRRILIVFALIFVAWLLRFDDYIIDGFLVSLKNNLRTYIYFAVFIYWALSLKSRIVQTSSRRYLWLMAVMMVAWMSIRTIKYFCVTDHSDLERFLWYLYYVPMMIMAVMGLCASLCFMKPRDYELPKWRYIFHLTMLIYTILILTNDYHQLIFVFRGQPFLETAYFHGALYYVIVGSIALTIFVSFVLILINGRFPKKKRSILIPGFFILVTLFYAIFYVLDYGMTRYLFGDMTVFFCVMCMFIWESCIQIGMIPVNSSYKELMEASEGISFQILNQDNCVKFASKGCLPIKLDDILLCRKAPIMLTQDIKLSYSPIHNGHVLWQEDMSEIIEINKKLHEAKKMLEDDNIIAKEMYVTSLRKHRLQEQNRLYDKMQRDTEKQVSMLMEQIKRCELDQDEHTLRVRLCHMTVLGVYLKRRCNLLMMLEEHQTMNSQELKKCFEESLSCIRLLSGECALKDDMPENISIEEAIELYDFFENTIEKIHAPIEAMFIRIYQDQHLTIRIMLESTHSLFHQTDDDGAQIITYCTGGDVS